MEFDSSPKHPFMEFDQFKLRAYSAKEIEKLSVLRIYQCKTFDALGFPIEGGLYDPALGPFENLEKCSTCQQNSKHCPGHVGHISLEVPVFNPVYFPFMLNLLKGTCVNCHQFMCDTKRGATKLLLAQLRCIELGLTDHAQALANEINEKLANTENKNEANDMLEQLTNFNPYEIDNAITKLTGKSIETLEKETGIPSKNAVDFKRTLLREYMKSNLFRHRVKCPLCKRRNGTFRNDGHRAVLIDFGVGGIFGKGSMKGKGKAAKKGIDEDADESKEFDDTGPIEELLDKMETEKAISADFLQSDNAL
uniref:DNA-directed RNA polymerase n=1 Tax=Panagrolaimus sp. ES5 TaxID=591445 RepID=A0AC34G3L2_9BILA